MQSLWKHSLVLCVQVYPNYLSPSYKHMLKNFSKYFKDIKFQQVIWNYVSFTSMSTDEMIAVWIRFLQNIRKSLGKVTVKAHIHKEHDRHTGFKLDGTVSQQKKTLQKYFPEFCNQKWNNLINDLPIIFSVSNIFLRFFIACGHLRNFRWNK